MENLIRRHAIAEPTEISAIDSLPCEPSTGDISSMPDMSDFNKMFHDSMPSSESDIDMRKMFKNPPLEISGLPQGLIERLRNMDKMFKNDMPRMSDFTDDMKQPILAFDSDEAMRSELPDVVQTDLNHLLDQLIGNTRADSESGGLRLRLPSIAVHVMEVHVVPREHHEDYWWRLVGLTVLIVLAVLFVMLLIWLLIKHCCSKKPQASDVEKEGNAAEGRAEHRMSLPSELPSLGSPDKVVPPPEAFIPEPFRAEAYLAQPFRADPDELAAMQVRMLAQLDATNQDWAVGHGGSDKDQLFLQ